ncbi:hypothetical protein QAD02_006089 [Eretmocerus hayati]|uniref:Uncharacterized protein n=1 Tax=Eretmocerus hayati TaxID=131215 RepID=A0ACC2N053_9HYME|nr:hypothetical protein QAD02_006089 [Eretmocerus hayati]
MFSDDVLIFQESFQRHEPRTLWKFLGEEFVVKVTMRRQINQLVWFILFISSCSHVICKKSGHAKICETETCRKTAKTILANMDKTINPCVDFYKYACGNYMKNEPFPAGLEKIEPIGQLHIQVMEQLNHTIWNIKKNDIQPLQKLLQYYKSCTDEEQINKKSEKKLLELIKNAGGWPVLEQSWNEPNTDWEKTIYSLYNQGMPHIFLINAFYSHDFKNNNTISIFVGEPVFKLPTYLLIRGQSDPWVQRYLAYIVDLAVMLGANPLRAHEELKEALDFEIELARISTPIGQNKGFIDSYHPTTIGELQKQCPHVSWMQYLTRVLKPSGELQLSERILVVNSDFLPNFCAKLRATSMRTRINYIFHSLVADVATQLSSRLRERAFQFNSEIGLGMREPRWWQCLSIMNSHMHLATSAIFARKVLKKETKADVSQLVQLIRQRMRHSLQHNNWMDSKTKRSAIDKFDAMTSLIAYPDELLDDRKLENYYIDLTIARDNFLENFLRSGRFMMNMLSKKSNNKFRKLEWTSSLTAGASANGVYMFSTNFFFLSAGLLQEPFFHVANPKYVNFGGLGSLAGHEMTHGFDDSGRKFEKRGGYVNWWNHETEKKFIDKSQCFVKQYERLKIADGIKVNGTLTLGENIADNGGVKQAYLAYKDWVTLNATPEPRLTGLTEFSQKQMFWLSYANRWCAKYRPGPISPHLLYEAHSPNYLRVMIPLMNIPDFAIDFKCSKDTPMNPAKRCHIW